MLVAHRPDQGQHLLSRRHEIRPALDRTDALRAILPRFQMDDEILLTALKQVEGIINGRPLTYLSLDPDDPKPITPFQILVPGANQPRCPDAPDFTKEMLDKIHQQATHIANEWWKRWEYEYVPTKATRSKWQHHRTNLEVGDVVLVIDDNALRDDWRLGRIVEVRPGADGIVRGAVVRMCLLEADAATNKSMPRSDKGRKC